jgi:translation elongation factor EF-Tu-like GTPase
MLRSTGALAAFVLACRPGTTPTSAPAAIPTTAPTPAPAPDPAPKGFRLVIDELVPGDAPMVMGHVVEGYAEIGDTLEVVGAEPPVRVQIRALENFRRPGDADAQRWDVGLLLELAAPADAAALVPGGTLRAAAPQ